MTDRNDEHRVMFCTLRRGHKSAWHTDGRSQWTSPRAGWLDERKKAKF